MRFSSKCQSQWDVLSIAVVLVSGQYITTKLLEYNARVFWTTVFHHGLHTLDFIWTFRDLVAVQVTVDNFPHG